MTEKWKELSRAEKGAQVNCHYKGDLTNWRDEEEVLITIYESRVSVWQIGPASQK